MRTRLTLSLAAAAGAVLLVAHAQPSQGARDWTDRFLVDRQELRSTGRNPYFVLEPGYQIVLEDGRDRLTITVLAETRVVDGVESRRASVSAAFVPLSTGRVPDVDPPCLLR